MDNLAKLEHKNIFTPLDVEKQEIRLLHVAPGSAADEISTSLHVLSLNNNPVYEALSYTWGNSQITEKILVNDGPFHVTHNLALALRRLRSPKSTCVVWIDAVCINQQDIGERNSQVLLMGRIYSSCSKCVVWLGEEDNETEAAFRLIKLWSQDVHYAEWQHLRDDMSAVNHLIERPWWSRIWTVQEAILSKQKMILCGGRSLPWETLILARDLVKRHMNMDCCHDKYYQDEAYASNLSSAVDTYKAAPGMDIIWLANAFRERQATDPRDKLIGLLTLVLPDEKGLITPDYNVDLQTLYKDFTVACIQDYGSLLPLSFILDDQPNADLPSWVPDWRLPHIDPVNQGYRLFRYNMFNTCSELQPRVIASRWNDSYVLRTDGVLFDAVSYVGRTDIENPEGALKSSYESVILILHNKYITGESFDHAFWRTVLLDTKFEFNENQEPNFVRTNSEFMPLALALGKELFDSVDANGQLTVNMNANEPSFTFSLVSGILHRRFFVTEQGYIGTGSSRMEVGDLVYVLSGGKSPLVLRTAISAARTKENDDTDMKDQALHTLVGDCYVHGIMDGEFMKGKKDNLKPVYII